MPRLSRAVAIGFPHDVTQKGNHKGRLFEHNNDFMQYLEWPRDHTRRNSLKIWEDCLMSKNQYMGSVPVKFSVYYNTEGILYR